MCKEAGEDVNHLQLHYGLTIRLWVGYAQLVGSSWVMLIIVRRVDVQLEEREKKEKTKDMEYGFICANVGCLEIEK